MPTKKFANWEQCLKSELRKLFNKCDKKIYHSKIYA